MIKAPATHAPAQLCPDCVERRVLPEPARTSLLVVLSFAAGVIFYSYALEQHDAQRICFPTQYETTQEK